MKYPLIVLAFLLLVQNSHAQEKQVKIFGAGISREELTEHVQILASDEYQGRETGKEGQKMAARYIREAFKELGLIGPGTGPDAYYQEFSLVKNAWEKLILVKNKDSLILGREMHATGSWPEGEHSLDIVFVGYGADSEYYSDYKELDVTGKIAAFLAGEPKDKKGKFLTTNSYVPEYSIVGYDKAAIAVNKGAVGAIMIDPEQSKIDKLIELQKRFSKSQQFFLPGTGTSDNSANGMIAISYEDACRLFDNNIEDWSKYEKKISRGKSQGGELHTSIKLISEKGINKIMSENVLGMIRGTEFPDEYIIVTAHYDHLGKREDNIFNGADDNASGTAAVIEIAEAFAEAAEAGYPPKRSIIFMPVSGEEKGLLGSRFYVSNPVVPIKNTKAALNMDMIGRQDDYADKDTSYVFIYMSDKPDSDLDLAVKKASELEGGQMITVYKYNDNNEINLGGSDHARFEKEGVPVLYFYCGTHEDYHRPTDTWEKLDYDNMTNIARIVFASAWQLANK